MRASYCKITLSVAACLVAAACVSAQERADEARQRASDAAHSGQFMRSAELFQRAIQLDPGHAGDYVLMGEALRNQGLHREAGEAFRNAILIDPDSPLARYNLGLSQLDLGMPAQAIDTFETMARLAPDYQGVYHMIGMAELSRGRRREAITAFRQAVAVDSASMDSRAFLAEALDAEDRRAAQAAWQDLLDAALSRPDGAAWASLAREKMARLVLNPTEEDWRKLFGLARQALEGRLPDSLDAIPGEGVLGERAFVALEVYFEGGSARRGIGKGETVAENVLLAAEEVRGRSDALEGDYRLKIDVFSHPAREARAVSRIGPDLRVEIQLEGGRSFRPGVDGMQVSEVLLLPSDALTQDLGGLAGMIAGAALRAGVDEAALARGDHAMLLFATTSAIEGPEDPMLLHAARPARPGGGRVAAREALVAAAGFLARLKADDGRLRSSWHAIGGMAGQASDDPVLLARAARILLAAGARGADPTALAAGARLLERLEARIYRSPDGRLCWLGQDGNVAATAAWYLASRERPGGAGRDGDAALAYLKLCRRSDGVFPNTFRPGDAFLSPYPMLRPGRVVAALAFAPESAADLSEAVDAILFRGQQGDLPAELLADPWLAEALVDLDSRRSERLYVDALFRAAEHVLAMAGGDEPLPAEDLAARYGPQQAAAACRILAAAWTISLRQRLPRDGFRKAAERFSEALRWLQVLPGDGYYLRKPEEAVGGVREGFVSNLLTLEAAVSAGEAWLEAEALPEVR